MGQAMVAIVLKMVNIKNHELMGRRSLNWKVPENMQIKTYKNKFKQNYICLN